MSDGVIAHLFAPVIAWLWAAHDWCLALCGEDTRLWVGAIVREPGDES